jgi:hypothetical protein
MLPTTDDPESFKPTDVLPVPVPTTEQPEGLQLDAAKVKGMLDAIAAGRWPDVDKRLRAYAGPAAHVITVKAALQQARAADGTGKRKA